MSRPRGGYIGVNPSPAASASNSAASGVWTLREAEALKRAGTWPTAFGGPTAITGLQLWLDASDSATLFDATTGGSLVAADGGVARWEDKSGNARHAVQSTSVNRPLRKTAIQGGLDVLRFDGTNDFMESTDFLDLSAGQAMTAFLVCKRASTGRFEVPISKYGFSNHLDISTQYGWLFGFTNDNTLRFAGTQSASIGSATRLSSAAVSASLFTTLALKASAGSLSSSTFYRNGSVIASTATANTYETLIDSSYKVTIGALRYTFNFDTDQYLQFLYGDIAEIIIYDSALSDANREAVENYLMAKWGIA